METRMKFTACLLFALIFVLSAQAEDPPFPKLSQIEIEFYETQVTLTDEDQDITILATEYYDNSVPRSRLDSLILGNRFSLFYNNQTNQILEVNGTNCQVWDTDESLYDYQPLFYGWLNKEPLALGPTAPIWYAQDHLNEVVPLGEKIVRDIKCQGYALNVTEKRQQLTYNYYFAVEGWTTPYQLDNLRVPIRIEVRGTSSKDMESEDMIRPVNQVTDFVYFRPTITNYLTFQPPVGIGCPLRKSSRTLPVFPKVFRYSAEVVDLIRSDKEEITTVQFQQVWYDSDRKIARLDNYTRAKYTSELYDFNTGVTYTISESENCKMGPLKNSFFEGYDGKVMGHLKDPDEVLDLDGSFYYMGKKLIRGIWADAFESVKLDVKFMQRDLDKLVVTIYYSQDFYKVAVDGLTETQVPIYYIVTGWVKNEIVINLQYNIFGFNPSIWPEMYQNFGVDSCFPTMMDKSYFIIPLSVEPDLAAKMEELNDLIMEELRIKISELCQISEMRLPLLSADYKTSGVFINGLMLDRPPALLQFIKRGNEDQIDNPNMKPIFDAMTREDCASACVDDGNLTCTSFHFCNQACFISSQDLDPTNPGVPQGMCEIWGRAERNSGLTQASLKEALVLLEASIFDEELKISIQTDEDTNAIITVKDIYFGEGPFSGKNDQEKPYKTVIKYRQFNLKDVSTKEMPYMDSVNDCYQACKSSDAISCSSFSYCPDATNKQCRISSILVVDRNHKEDDLEDARDCFVYSMTYLDYYEPLPGKSVLVSGEDVYKSPSVELCAKMCRLESKFACRGFEYCRVTEYCVLHSKHILDLKAGEIAQNSKSTCTHYSAKFVADYYDMGFTLLEDSSDVRKMLTLEECSRTCSEELKGNCKSFNYCPESGPGFGDNSCSLSSKTLTDKGITTTTEKQCHHYEKKNAVDDWGTTKVKTNTVVSTSGYTSKGFTGLVIGMLALGLVLGAIGFVLFSYFRSKQSGEGMSVRFMKSDI